MGKKKLDQIVGTSFEDLNTEDMQNTQGAGDVDAETTPVIMPICSPSAVVNPTLALSLISK
ncbi:lichenicidin A2 family type 2 lantibiotic [Butyrivibrio sp. INlla21]|uniref:lichenicidin A2 family type 2 lantibiotic n=1 Tax=Butyrivibrio sp. INlla21 TaxID=1520811 RepID=UPI0008E573C5|nr:lichenicidin A2 family type 2 lantibiotic [Butyrivibrio sp. INlla21]SFU96265.1 type 2 lantibiotic, SP_1948 family [Butyrivibrio sp. INlla21]